MSDPRQESERQRRSNHKRMLCFKKSELDDIHLEGTGQLNHVQGTRLVFVQLVERLTGGNHAQSLLPTLPPALSFPLALAWSQISRRVPESSIRTTGVLLYLSDFVLECLFPNTRVDQLRYLLSPALIVSLQLLIIRDRLPEPVGGFNISILRCFLLRHNESKSVECNRTCLESSSQFRLSLYLRSRVCAGRSARSFGGLTMVQHLKPGIACIRRVNLMSNLHMSSAPAVLPKAPHSRIRLISTMQKAPRCPPPSGCLASSGHHCSSVSCFPLKR